MEQTKNNRMLEIFFRALRGEVISVKKIAKEYSVSSKSISRDISEIQAFLAEHLWYRKLFVKNIGMTKITLKKYLKFYKEGIDIYNVFT